MKTKIHFLVAIVTFMALLQGCSKEPHPIHLPFPLKNELLLSKVTGIISSTDPNFDYSFLNNNYTYIMSDRNPISHNLDSGKFQINYSYQQNKNSECNYNVVVEDSFLNKGHYDFFYSGLFPSKVIDNSFPGYDFGYWKFYYNDFKQVSKIGLAFSTTTDPVRFEYYKRDFRNNISSFVYGIAIDKPYMKVLYKYNWQGDISQFDIYLAKDAPQPTTNVAPAQEDLKSRLLKTQNIQSIKQRAFQNWSNYSKGNSINKQQMSDAIAAGVDTSVYSYYLTAKVTTNNTINPFSQQGNIFFYQTNRWYSFYDPSQFYLSLLKNNPVRIEYSVPFFGPDIATQTFCYTYNGEGYPVTVHEVFTDPDFGFVGDYTRDSRIEYIHNR